MQCASNKQRLSRPSHGKWRMSVACRAMGEVGRTSSRPPSPLQPQRIMAALVSKRQRQPRAGCALRPAMCRLPGLVRRRGKHQRQSYDCSRGSTVPACPRTIISSTLDVMACQSMASTPEQRGEAARSSAVLAHGSKQCSSPMPVHTKTGVKPQNLKKTSSQAALKPPPPPQGLPVSTRRTFECLVL